MTFWQAILLLLAGGVATSLAEYFLKYNLIDKLIDLFRSAESIAQKELSKGEALAANASAKLRNLRSRL